MAEKQALVKFLFEEKGSKDVISATKQIDQSVQKAGDNIRDAFRGQSVDALNKRLAGTRDLLRASLTSSDDLTESLKDAANAAKNIDIPNRPSGQNTSSRGNALGSSELVFGQFQALTSNIPGGSDISGAIGGLKDITEAIQKIPAAAAESGLSVGQFVGGLGAAGLAVGAISLAFSALTSAIEAARKAEQEHTDQILENAGRTVQINELIASGDVEGVQSGIAAAQERYNIAQQSYQDLLARQTELEAERQGVINDYGDTFNQFGLEVNARIDENNAAQQTQLQVLADAQDELGDYSNALGLASQAQREGALSAEQLATATEQANQAILQSVQSRVNAEVEYFRLAESASSESIQARIDENALRLQMLEEERQNLINTATVQQDNSVAINNLTQQINSLNTDTERLTGGILQSAQAREQEAEATRQATDAARESATAELRRAAAIEQASQQIQQITQQIAQQAQADALTDARAQRDLARNQLRESLDFQRQQADALRQFHEQQSQAIREFQEAQKEAQSETIATEKEYRDKEIDRLKKFEKRLADIRRDASLELGEAAGELDAKRAYAALQARDKELTDAVDANDEEAEANREARDERLAQIREQLSDEQAALQQRLAQEAQAFAAQQAQERAAFNERRQRENEDRAIRRGDELQDRAARLAAQRAQIADLQASINQEKNIRKAGLNAALSDFTAFVNGIRNATKNLQNNVGGGSKPIPGKGTPPPSIPKPPTGGGGSSGSWGGNKGGVKLGAGGIALAGREGFGHFEKDRDYDEAIVPLRPDVLRGLSPTIINMTNNLPNVQNAQQFATEVEPLVRRIVATAITRR